MAQGEHVSPRKPGRARLPEWLDPGARVFLTQPAIATVQRRRLAAIAGLVALTT